MSEGVVKIFTAADLALPQAPVAAAEDIGAPVEFWLKDGAAGAIGHLVGVFPESPVPQIAGPLAIVRVADIGRFALPLSHCHLLPAGSSPAAGSLPPSGRPSREPDGGFSLAAQEGAAADAAALMEAGRG